MRVRVVEGFQIFGELEWGVYLDAPSVLDAIQ